MLPNSIFKYSFNVKVNDINLTDIYLIYLINFYLHKGTRSYRYVITLDYITTTYKDTRIKDKAVTLERLVMSILKVYLICA